MEFRQIVKLYFDYDGIEVTALSTIKEVGSDRTLIWLDTIFIGYFTAGLFKEVDREYMENFKSLSAKEFTLHFDKNFIQSIMAGKTVHLFFDNKEIDDWYKENRN
ncbi:MAG: hypothetical protein M3512_12070 [Bacteroidota bacterium]|nr:hypothetical protein [Bacteroidota bacterium]